jgi:hypothetical protein
MILELPDDGSVFIEVPDRLRKLVPKSLKIEAIQHPTGEKQYCIIKNKRGKIKHVGLMLTDEELNLETKDLNDRYLTPAIDILRRSFNW